MHTAVRRLSNKSLTELFQASCMHRHVSEFLAAAAGMGMCRVEILTGLAGMGEREGSPVGDRLREGG